MHWLFVDVLEAQEVAISLLFLCETILTAVEEGDVCGVDALIRFSSHLKRPRPRSKAASARDPDPKEAGTT